MRVTLKGATAALNSGTTMDNATAVLCVNTGSTARTLTVNSTSSASDDVVCKIAANGMLIINKGPLHTITSDHAEVFGTQVSSSGDT